MQQKIAVIGSGQVGEVLANGFLANGHPVMRASREPGKLGDWKAKASGEASVGTSSEAAQWADVIVLCVKGTGAEAVVKEIAGAIAGKLVLDATNPIADAPPEGNCIRYFTNANESLMERLQALAPAAKFVKAFNSVGNAFMVNPKFAQKPTMFICGSDAAAKTSAAKLIEAFGWESADMGSIEVARPIEALCQLWCAPGFARNDWAHAFKRVTL